MTAVKTVQRLFRRVGVELGNTRWSVPYRRVQILQHRNVELLLDVGANFGQYGGELRDAGWRRRILSFEPGSDAYQRLQQRVSRDPLWQARQVALGDQEGELALNISEESRFSSMLPVLTETVDRSATFRYSCKETVSVHRLDDIAAEFPRERLAVKIDVQGFERQVLDGAPDVLARVQVVEMEMTAHPVYDGQMLVLESMQRMADAGLVLSLTENIYVDIESGRSLQFNGIFVRE